MGGDYEVRNEDLHPINSLHTIDTQCCESDQEPRNDFTASTEAIEEVFASTAPNFDQQQQ